MKRTIHTLSLLHISLFSFLAWSQEEPKGTHSLQPTQEWVDQLKAAYNSPCNEDLKRAVVEPPDSGAFVNKLGDGFEIKRLLNKRLRNDNANRTEINILTYNSLDVFNTRFDVFYRSGEVYDITGGVFVKRPEMIEAKSKLSKEQISDLVLSKDRYSIDILELGQGYIYLNNRLYFTYKLAVYSKMGSHSVYFIPSLNCYWWLDIYDPRVKNIGKPTMEEIRQKLILELKEEENKKKSEIRGMSPKAVGSCEGEGLGLEVESRYSLLFPERQLCTEITPVYAGLENAPTLFDDLLADIAIVKQPEGSRNDKFIWSINNDWYNNPNESEYGITSTHLEGKDMDIPFAYRLAVQAFYTADNINSIIQDSFSGDRLVRSKIEIYPFSEFGAQIYTPSAPDLNFEIDLHKGDYSSPFSAIMPQAACPDTIAHELGHSIMSRAIYWKTNTKNVRQESILETYADLFSIAMTHLHNNGYTYEEIPETQSPLETPYTKELFQVASCWVRTSNALEIGRFLLDPKLSGEIDHISQFDFGKDEHYNSTALSLPLAYLMFPKNNSSFNHPTYGNQVPSLRGIGFRPALELINQLFVTRINSNNAFFSIARQELENDTANRFGRNSYEHRAVSDAFEAVGIFHPTVAVQPLQTYEIPYALENSTRLFQIPLPATVDLATIRLDGSNGNADIYYTFGPRLDPWLGDYEGRSQDFGSNDELVIPRNLQGPPAVLTFAVHATEAFSDLRLHVELQGSGFSTPMGVDLPQSESAPFQRKLFPIQIPRRNQKRSGDPNYDICYTPNTRLVITTRGGQEHENLDLYLKKGREAAFNDYDFRATDGRANETLEVLNPPPGEWFLALNSQTAYDDVVLRIEYYENEMYDNLEMRINADEGEVVHFTKPIAEGSTRLRIDANGGEGRFHFYANPYPAPADLADWQFATNDANALKIEIREPDLDTDRYALAITPQAGHDLRHVKYFATLSPRPRDQPPQLLVAGHESTLLDGGLDIYRFKSGAILNVQGSLPWSSRIQKPNFRPLVSVDIFQDGRLLEQRSTISDCRGLSEFQLELTPEMIGSVQLKFVYQYYRGESVPAWLNLDVQHDGDFLGDTVHTKTDDPARHHFERAAAFREPRRAGLPRDVQRHK